MCLSGFSLERYCQKILTKSRGFRKKIKRKDGHLVGGGGGRVYRREWVKTSAHCTLQCLNHGQKVESFQAKLDPNCHFPWKEDFLRKLINTTFVYLLCSIMLLCFKNNPDSRADHEIQDLAVWVPNWTQITHLLLQGIFFEN